MLTNKIDENTYEILVYDWVNLNDDYIAGHVKRDLEANEESDLSYWMFYPAGTKSPLNCGDISRLYTFISELN